jgi:AraC family transcriptional regulator of adaptative response/methylated-DNA-[protein]-cysteine methyltransferase
MSEDYNRIAKAISYLRDNSLQQPSLEQVAMQVGLSPCHLQRLFCRWTGVSPKRFLQFLTARHAKQLLRRSYPILETSFAVGLSGPSRLHDLLISVEAVTPGEYKNRGEGLLIEYGQHPTPFGECLIATTPRGICLLNFLDSTREVTALQALAASWPKAEFKEKTQRTLALTKQIFYPKGIVKPLPLLLSGTNFQIKVWQALLQIPAGALASYGYLSTKLENPGAARAVGTAIGQNPIGYLIPCHRVLRGDGEIGGYRWGVERKLSILSKELSQEAFEG